MSSILDALGGITDPGAGGPGGEPPAGGSDGDGKRRRSRWFSVVLVSGLGLALGIGAARFIGGPETEEPTKPGPVKQERKPAQVKTARSVSPTPAAKPGKPGAWPKVPRAKPGLPPELTRHPGATKASPWPVAATTTGDERKAAKPAPAAKPDTSAPAGLANFVAARKKALAEGGTEGLKQFDEAFAVLTGSVKQALPGRVTAPAVPTDKPVPAKKPAPKAVVAKAAPVAPPPPPVVVETPAASSAAKVLEAAPADAPRIDILFIQWGDERSERLASLRSQGGSLSVVYEGDVIDGMAVASIRADAIDFTWRGQTFRQPVHRY